MTAKKKTHKKVRQASKPLYHKMTDAEVRTFAERWYRGEIFTDRNMREMQTPDANAASMLKIVFMPLGFMRTAEIRRMKKNPPHLIYAEMSECIPGRAINGYPIFMMCGFVSKEDTERILASYNALLDAVKARP